MALSFKSQRPGLQHGVSALTVGDPLRPLFLSFAAICRLLSAALSLL